MLIKSIAVGNVQCLENRIWSHVYSSVFCPYVTQCLISPVLLVFALHMQSMDTFWFLLTSFPSHALCGQVQGHCGNKVTLSHCRVIVGEGHNAQLTIPACKDTDSIGTLIVDQLNLHLSTFSSR